MRTNWPHSKEKPGENLAVAMPHGWAVAESWLLMRDSIFFEEEDRLILLAGVPPEWFGNACGVRTGALPTYFGTLSIDYCPGRPTLGGTAAPPGG